MFACNLLLEVNYAFLMNDGPSRICGRQPLKYQIPYPFKFCKSYLPQILLGPLLNALSQIVFPFLETCNAVGAGNL